MSNLELAFLFMTLVIGVCFVGLFMRDGEAKRLRKNLRELREESIRLSDVAEDAAQVLDEMRLELLKERKRSGEYLDKIEEVLKERDGWRDLYNDQASGHDNAQQLMIRQIEYAAQVYLRDTGKHLRLDPLVETVRQDWCGSHGEEARHGRAGADAPEVSP